MKDCVLFIGDYFYFNGKVKLGLVYKDVDGYYVFIPIPNSGFYNEYSLRLIADKLQELNKEWDDYIKATLK